jgi:hypothetical protein
MSKSLIKKSSKKLTLKLDPDKYVGDTLIEKGASIAVDPTIKAALTTHLYTANITEIDPSALVDRVQKLVKEVSAGDMSYLELMLASQAIVLDSIFHRLSSQAQQNIGHFVSATDTYLRLALKAQAQCRSNIESLANIKSPRQYISHTNVANLMQVNNSHECIEASNGERMDFGAQTETVRDDQGLEALAAFNRSKNA